MNTKLTFFVGLNDKDTHVQSIPTLEASRIVERVFLAHNCDGATISSGRGIYRHESGEVVVEETLIVQVFEFEGCESVDVRGICTDLKMALNQESIAVERRQTDSALY